jgi:DNA-binding transcriptional LysR family regulator
MPESALRREGCVAAACYTRPSLDQGRTMQRIDFNNLQAFIVVAREGSFTRAAAKLGVTQSALSHSMRALEAKLDVRLLTRSTRGAATTEAGQKLFAALEAHYDGIEAGVAALGDARGRPAGTVRITADDHAASSVLWPRLAKVLANYPELKVEIDVNYGMIDIVAQRFDAGVRLGDQVAKDMIALRISPDLAMAVVGAPGYFKNKPAPDTPEALTGHDCINMRLPTYGGMYAWEFVQEGRSLQVQVDGQCIFNSTPRMIQAAVDGYGLAYVPDDMIADHVAAGRLQRVLADWCPTFPGYHLYYPSRRQASPAFVVAVEALRAGPLR